MREGRAGSSDATQAIHLPKMVVGSTALSMGLPNFSRDRSEYSAEDFIRESVTLPVVTDLRL